MLQQGHASDGRGNLRAIAHGDQGIGAATRAFQVRVPTLRASRRAHADRGRVDAGAASAGQSRKENGRNAQDTSYIWVYRSAEDSEQPVVLLEHQPGRGQQYPKDFLGDYAGTLMTDGWPGRDRTVLRSV